MKIQAAEDYLEENPHIKRIPYATQWNQAGTGDRTKPPAGFKDLLQKIADKSPGSKLAQDYGRKDPTTVRTRNTIEKVKKKLGMDE